MWNNLLFKKKNIYIIIMLNNTICEHYYTFFLNKPVSFTQLRFVITIT